MSTPSSRSSSSDGSSRSAGVGASRSGRAPARAIAARTSTAPSRRARSTGRSGRPPRCRSRRCSRSGSRRDPRCRSRRGSRPGHGWSVRRTSPRRAVRPADRRVPRISAAAGGVGLERQHARGRVAHPRPQRRRAAGGRQEVPSTGAKEPRPVSSRRSAPASSARSEAASIEPVAVERGRLHRVGDHDRRGSRGGRAAGPARSRATATRCGRGRAPGSGRGRPSRAGRRP